MTAWFQLGKLDINQRFGSVKLSLPSRQLQVITIQSDELYTFSTRLCDLAITEHEIINNVSGNSGNIVISVPVHNIGIVEAENIEVGIYDGEKLIKNLTIDKIDAPLNLESKTVILEIELERSGIKQDGISINIDPDNKINEITLINNVVYYQIRN